MIYFQEYFQERSHRKKLERFAMDLPSINYKNLKRIRETKTEEEKKLIDDEIIRRTINKIKYPPMDFGSSSSSSSTSTYSTTSTTT